jgi:hypothetical protein
MIVIARPELCNPRTADSRPAPGPDKLTSISFMPTDMAALAASCAATVAANAEDLRDPMYPAFPAEDQDTTFPVRSVIDTIVLLNVAVTWAIPLGTLRIVFFFLAMVGFFAIVFCVVASCLAKGHSPLFLLVRDSFSLSFACSRIGTGALASNWESQAVSHTTVAVDADQSLNVILDLSSQISFDNILRCQNGVDFSDVVFI